MENDDNVFESLQELITRANNGKVEAQLDLAVKYLNGQDVEQNYQEADFWF